jgi:hypothetical protein
VPRNPNKPLDIPRSANRFNFDAQSKDLPLRSHRYNGQRKL